MTGASAWCWCSRSHYMKQSIKLLKWYSSIFSTAVLVLKSGNICLAEHEPQHIPQGKAGEVLENMEKAMIVLLNFRLNAQDVELLRAEMQAFKAEMQRKHNIPPQPD